MSAAKVAAGPIVYPSLPAGLSLDCRKLSIRIWPLIDKTQAGKTMALQAMS